MLLPKWFQIRDLEDLKSNLVSVVIAVLAVLFLRETVSWDGSRDILAFGTALALVVAALTFFLKKEEGVIRGSLDQVICAQAATGSVEPTVLGMLLPAASVHCAGAVAEVRTAARHARLTV